MSPAHLDTSFRPQEVFIFPSWVYKVSCSIIAVESCGFLANFIILKTLSGLIQNPRYRYIYSSSGGTPSCSMRSASHFPSQWCLWLSLGITKPHLDPTREGWGATLMIWWEKWDIFNVVKELSKHICHPYLFMSTQMVHMAGKVCLLQTLLKPHYLLFHSILSHVSSLCSF